MKTIGQTSNARKETRNLRFSVTTKLNGKVLYKSAGMLFKDADEAEGWVARTLTNCGVTLEKGTTLTAERVDVRK